MSDIGNGLESCSTIVFINGLKFSILGSTFPPKVQRDCSVGV